MKRSHDRPLVTLRVIQLIFILPALIIFWICYAKEHHNEEFFYVADGRNQLFAGIVLIFALLYVILTALLVHGTTRRLKLALLIIVEIVLAIVLGVVLLFNERFERDYGAFVIDTERGYRARACSYDYSGDNYKDMGYKTEAECLKSQRSLVWAEYTAAILTRIVILFNIMTVGWLAKSIYDLASKRRSDGTMRV